MAKVFIEETNLTAIGDAIRSKTGKSDLLSPTAMPAEIEAIQAGGGGEAVEVTLTGDCSYACRNGAWNSLFDYVKTENLSKTEYMFYYNQSVETIPFAMNFGSSAASAACMFQMATKLKEVPVMSNWKISSTNNMFRQCYNLRTIPDDQWTLSVNSSTSNNHTYMFYGCYSLRQAPMKFMNAICESFTGTGSYYCPMDYGFYQCYSLDEIIGFYPIKNTLTGNWFNQTFANCARAKNITFATDENGNPYVRNWTKQTIDLSTYIGYYDGNSYFINYNSGLTTNNEVSLFNEKYNDLKDTPDWYATHSYYSRYNHDSAVATINSLPDCSQVGGNTIKFKGVCGTYTDGGAISNLTEEEIAVATAKGWTVTLV